MSAVACQWSGLLPFLPYYASSLQDSTPVRVALTNLRDSCGHEAVHEPSAEVVLKLPHTNTKAKGAGPLGSQAHGVEALPHASILLQVLVSCSQYQNARLLGRLPSVIYQSLY